MYVDEWGENEGFDLKNVDFSAAVGFVGIPIDPTYGSISISHVKKTINIA